MRNHIRSNAHILASVLVVLHLLAVAFHIVAILPVLAWRQATTQRGAKSRLSANPRRITAYVVLLTWKRLLGSLTAAPIRPPLIAFQRFHRSAGSPTLRSGNSSAIGHLGLLALVRAYLTGPYKPPDDRKKERLLISNPYRAVGSRPEHLRIVAVPSGSENEYILVTEDMPVQRGLRRHGRAGPCSRWRPKRSQRPGRPRRRQPCAGSWPALRP